MERGPRLQVVEGPYLVEEVGALSHAQTTPNPSHVQLPKPSIPSAAASSTTTAEAEGWQTLVVVNELHVVPKEVQPIDNQHPFESRRLCRNVTGNSLTRSFLVRRRDWAEGEMMLRRTRRVSSTRRALLDLYSC